MSYIPDKYVNVNLRKIRKHHFNKTVKINI